MNEKDIKEFFVSPYLLSVEELLAQPLIFAIGRMDSVAIACNKIHFLF